MSTPVVKKEWPKVPDDWLLLQTGSGVSQSVAEELRKAALKVHDYAKNLGFPKPNERVTILAYPDLGSLAGPFEAATGRALDKDSVGPKFAASEHAVVNGTDWMAVNLSASNLKGSPSHRQRMLVRHLINVVFRQTSDLPLWASRDELPPAGPRWLVDGGKRYFAEQAPSPTGTGSCDARRNRGAVRIGQGGPSLSTAETRTGLSSLPRSYDYTYLAIDLLAGVAGRESVVSYFASLRRGTPWQETFEATFGMPVDAFYQLFQERWDEGFPAPRCSTLPPLTKFPGSPDYVGWYVEEGVASRIVEATAEGMWLMDQYGRTLGMPEPTRGSEVYLYHDVGNLAALYSTLTGQDAERSLEYWKNGTAASGGNYWVGSSTKLEKNTAKIAAHELFHIFQRDMSGLPSGSADDEIPLTGPRWLKEGVAEYLAYQAVDAGGVLDYGFERNRASGWGIARRANRVTLALRDMTVQNQIRDVPYRYPYFMLAAELLAHHAGADSLIRLYMVMGPDTTWQEAFQEVFDMDVDEFYDLFEEHRAAGFPKLDS